MAQVQMPDGTIVEMPDELTPELAARLRALQQSTSAPAPAPPPDFASNLKKLASGPFAESEGDRASQDAKTVAKLEGMGGLAGSPVGQLATGAAGVVTGPLQLGANIGDWVAEKIGLHPTVGKAINDALAEHEANKQRGMAGIRASGQETPGGLDVAGAMASGGAAVKGITPAATMVGKIAQGAGIGAGLGAATPVTSGGDRYFDEKGDEIVLGAALGAAVQPLISGAAYISKYPYHLVERYLPGGKERVQGSALNAAAGEQAPQVASALEQAKPIVPGSMPTAGEAAADVNAPGFAALQKRVSGITPDSASQYRAIRLAQEEARSRALSTPPAKLLEKIRNEVTAPMRETALGGANAATAKTADLSQRIYQKTGSAQSAVQQRWRLLTDATRQENLSKNFYPVPGMPRVSPVHSPNAPRVSENREAAQVFENVAAQRKAEQGLLEYQLASLEAHGLKPLTATPILSKIDSTLADPAFKASNKAPILASLRSKIEALTDKNGTIDANSLYTVRKELNETIETLLGGANAQGSKKRAAELADQLKPVIDKAIDTSAGGGWMKYLKTYSDLSRKVDQSRILQHLNDVLASPLEGGKERAAVFANAMRDAPKTIKQTTGFGGYDSLDKVLTPEQMKSVTSVLDDLNRQSKYAAQAKEGTRAINRQVGEDEHAFPTIQMFSKPVTLMNAAIRRIQGGAGQKTLDELSAVMQDPKQAAELMRRATEREREAMKLIAKLKTPRTTGEIVSGAEAERTNRKAEPGSN